MNKSLSKEQQVLLKEELIKRAKVITAKLEEEGVREARDLFIEKFIVCETLYKMVLKKYLEVNQSYDPKKNMTIQIQQVRSAFSKAGFIADLDLLDHLFSGSGNYKLRGQKSCKMLRNGIEHEMNIHDLQEVLDRKEELLGYLDTFINWIQEG